MKIKRLLSILLVLCLVIVCSNMIVFADDTETNSTSGVRNSQEIEELKSIYKQLFSNEYHYIENYENNGAVVMKPNEIETIFYGEKDQGDTTYELWVLSNGQVFTNVISNISGLSSRTANTTKSFQVGDLGYYLTFTISYTINTNGYDKITSYEPVTGSGFLITPLGKKVKLNEDASEPAYLAYINAEIQNGTGVLYDLGVAVGNNKAKGVWQISSGWKAWLQYAISIIWQPG